MSNGWNGVARHRSRGRWIYLAPGGSPSAERKFPPRRRNYTRSKKPKKAQPLCPPTPEPDELDVHHMPRHLDGDHDTRGSLPGLPEEGGSYEERSGRAGGAFHYELERTEQGAQES